MYTIGQFIKKLKCNHPLALGILKGKHMYVHTASVLNEYRVLFFHCVLTGCHWQEYSWRLTIYVTYFFKFLKKCLSSVNLPVPPSLFLSLPQIFMSLSLSFWDGGFSKNVYEGETKKPMYQYHIYIYSIIKTTKEILLMLLQTKNG
jgi:hypothetical protein